MHMSDALTSPAVGLGLWAVAGAGLFVAAKAMEKPLKETPQIIPLAGVIGAFVFAAQMVNVSIPGTGASGHLTGATLLAALLGPPAAVVVIGVILLLQALLFADGGILAYGANVINMALIPCFLVFPFLWRPIAGSTLIRPRIMLASVVAGVVSVVLSATAVAFETYASGITTLPLGGFLAVIVPIHFVIGLSEGLLTGGILLFALNHTMFSQNAIPSSGKQPIILGFGLATLCVAGGLVLFTSSNPDGLEWSVAQVEQNPTIYSDSSWRRATEEFQSVTSLLPDYDVPQSEESTQSSSALMRSAIGVIGSALTLILVFAVVLALRARRRP